MVDKRLLLNNKVYIFYNDAIEIIRGQGLEPSREVEHALVSKAIGIDYKLALLEEDFNMIVSEYYPNKPLLIQYTFVDSLALRAESIKNIYPLKMLFAKDMFERKAKDKNMSFDDYLALVDFPEEVEKERSLIEHKYRAKEKIGRYKEELEEAVPEDVFERFGLEIQTLSEISEHGIGFMTFIAGDGIFYEYEPEFIKETLWETAIEENGIISAVDCSFSSEKLELKRVNGRDFRQFSVIDNILYCLQNFEAANEWQDYLSIRHDAVSVEVHIKFLSKLLNKDNLKHEIYVAGIPEH